MHKIGLLVKVWKPFERYLVISFGLIDAVRELVDKRLYSTFRSWKMNTSQRGLPTRAE